MRASGACMVADLACAVWELAIGVVAMLTREQIALAILGLHEELVGKEGAQKTLALIDRTDAALRDALAHRCEHCGSKLNLNGCLVCGAPQCCPSCCRVTTLESKLATMTAERDEQMRRKAEAYKEVEIQLGKLAQAQARCATLEAALKELEVICTCGGKIIVGTDGSVSAAYNDHNDNCAKVIAQAALKP